MDRYNSEDERRYDRGEPDRPESEPSGAPGDFPWQDPAGTDQPSTVWEEPPADHSTSAGPSAVAAASGEQGNPLAITGFVCSLVMWTVLIFFPPLSFVLWILALTFSSIGLSRSRRLGAPHKGLATAGLCLSLLGVVIVIFFVVFLVGVTVSSSN